ncbi:helix-turn-helix transcriptional regulator [Fulvivirga ulvae]|uniref:helix-turn-helix domain-containing protein n=1 Tax=Fulvivirga ulvae TaxID=2904245 RepID=UPI001F3E152C|nr:helix-turn-helix transcriptional regulator [Fulvivirga ulvae]UII31584.1 helix-turn-helix transcriptional regulator [Fulvivirga ulvae]
MNYEIIPPPTRLSPFIRFYWILESNEPYLHRGLADGCAEMIFHYDGIFDELGDNNLREKSFSSGLHGPTRKVRRFIIDRGFGIFGVYIYPFAIQRLFSLPTIAVSNEMPDLKTLLGTTGDRLEEQIMMASNNYERANILSTFFEHQLTKTRQVPANISVAVHQMLNSKGIVDIPALAEYCCLSLRQFERKFKEYSGFSPKLYSRIIRFQTAAAQYGNYGKSLTEIAYQCGYYDQSHFINDFKEFSGFNPSTYFSGEAEGTAWRDSEMS